MINKNGRWRADQVSVRPDLSDIPGFTSREPVKRLSPASSLARTLVLLSFLSFGTTPYNLSVVEQQNHASGKQTPSMSAPDRELSITDPAKRDVVPLGWRDRRLA